MTWTTSTKLDLEQRGNGIAPEHLDVAARLRKQAYELQRRFDLAEHSALILEQMLGNNKDDVGPTIDSSYEAHTFVRLRMQLFRILLVDLWACVLDKNPHTGSIRSILKELRRDTAALDALRAYYSDTTGIVVEVAGQGLDDEFIEQQKKLTLQRHIEEAVQSFDARWASVDKDLSILQGDDAKRMIWARHKATAHFEKTATGIVALDDDPPYGKGKLTWDEPIRFLSKIRPYAYDVFLLLTANSWSDDFIKINRFYTRAFWDRFKNGKTDLEP